MAEVVRSLVVELRFDADASELSQFNSETEQTTTGAVAMGTAIGNAAVSFAKFGVQAVRGAVGALKDMVSEQVAVRDEIAKTAGNLDISAESYQELAFAAEQTGASAADIEKAMFSLQRQLDAANRGSTEASIAFDTLGVSREELGKALAEGDGIQALGLMAEGFSNTEEGAERSAASLALLGRGGKTLGNLLEGGTAQLEDLAQQARDTGDVFSGEALADFESFADEQNRLSHQIEGVKGRIVGAALPALEGFTTGIGEVIGENQTFIEQDLPELIGQISEVALELIPIIIEWAKEAKTLFDQWQQLREDMENTDTTIGSVTESIGTLIDFVNDLNDALPGPIKSLEKLLSLQQEESVQRGPARFKGESDEAFERRKASAKAAREEKKARQKDAEARIEDAKRATAELMRITQEGLKGTERDEAASRRRRRAAKEREGKKGKAAAKKETASGKGAIGLAGRRSITAEELFKLGELVAAGEGDVSDADLKGAVAGTVSQQEQTRSSPTFSSREGRGASPAQAAAASTVIHANFQPNVNVSISVEGTDLLDLGPDGQGEALTRAVERVMIDIMSEQDDHFQRTTRGL